MRTQPETIKESGVPWICLSNSSPENNAVISLVEDLLFDAHSLHGLQKSLQLCHCHKYLLFNLLRFHKLVGVKKNTEKKSETLSALFANKVCQLFAYFGFYFPIKISYS